MTTSYRTGTTSLIQNSSDEGEIDGSDSNSDAENPSYLKKRTKFCNASINPQINNSSATNGATRTDLFAKAKKSKNANIWGSVLTEQSSQDISANLGAVGMQHLISRGPESFDLPANLCHKKKDVESDSDDSLIDETQEHQITEVNMEMEEQKVSVVDKNGANPRGNRRKRKATHNKKNVPTFKPGQEVRLNKRCDLSDTDPVDKVAEEIAFRLWERKKDLIRHLTKTLGVRATIDFCNKTESIEKNGGLLTMTGLRRRTPGGTFLYLIRNDHKLDQEPINNIFRMESERERLQWEQRKIVKSKKRLDQLNHADLNETNAMVCTESNKFVNVSSEVLTSDFTQNIKNSKNTELSDGEIVDTDEDFPSVENFG